MAFAANIIRPPSPRMSNPLEEYDDDSSTDSDETPATRPRSRSSFAPSNPPTGPSALPRPEFLFPPTLHSGRSSVSSTATNTPLPSRSTSPLPSRSTSPLPQFYHSNPSSSCTSDTDSEPISSLIRENRTLWWRRENRRKWWSISRRRRKRDGRIVRILKKWARRLVRHPFFPSQPITIVLTLILLSIFAIFLTLLLIYILNPDKEPLPWRSYCSASSLSALHDPLSSSSTSPHSDTLYGNTFPPFLPSSMDIIPPAGVFVGVFSIDSGFERRMLVRTTWASHPHSRDGAGEGDGGVGTSRTVVRFVLGQPRKDWERRIKLEMEMYNDIIILPISENMNGGKSHSFFSWASINAWVPPVYTNSTVPPPRFSYSNNTVPPPPLAPHDSTQAWEDRHYGTFKPWVRPDYVVKVDDDSFVMLAELEWRLRLELHAKPQTPPSTIVKVTPTGNITYSSTTETSSNNPPRTHLSSSATDIKDPLIYWGYLVTNRLHKFMAGELYALSWSLTEWVANDPVVKGMTRGAEDKQTAKWMKQHPQASEIRWASERCWIYDHPRSGTVYAHGFLFPSEVTRVKHGMMTHLEKPAQDILNNPTVAMGGTPPPTPSAWAYSSVSTFGVRYTPPLPDLSTTHSVEALVEGSDMSTIREGGPMTPEYAWTHREGREKRYEGNRVGGTVVVHFIKKNMWYLETALALLEGEALSESEKFQSRELEKATMESSSSAHPHSHTSRKIFSKYVRR